MSKVLDDDWIGRIHKAVLDAGLAGNRDALLSLIDSNITSHLPIQDDPAAQILSDLGKLNGYEPSGKPLDTSPIASWLKAAIRLSQGQEPCAVFEEALAELRSRRPSAPEDLTPAPPGPGLKIRFKMIALVVGALIVGIGGVLIYINRCLFMDSKDCPPPSASLKPSTPPASYCSQPPAFIPGSDDYAFATGLSDSDADKTRVKMKQILEGRPPNGLAWAAAISKSPSIGGLSKWDVYFKGMDSKTDICKWLTTCDFSRICHERVHFQNDPKKVVPETPKEKNP